MGGRAGVRDAVPHQAGRQLQVPVHHRGAGGHAVVARAQLLAQGHRLRRAHHPPQGEQDLPLRQALPRSPRCPRGVVGCEPDRCHPGGAEDRRRTEHLRRVHHKRPVR
uniref:Uncharacterized protein n=1 Tax=Arundo donax TaxID=35708 RepID=A0A0A9CR54_ARUDO